MTDSPSLCQKLVHRSSLFGVLLCLLLPISAASAADDPLRVMTFNVRYGTAPDGDNHWKNRRNFVIDVVREAAPDLMGMQEMLLFQSDDLLDELPEYDSLGVGRDDGVVGGEMSPLFFRRDRFEVLQWGTRWLAETPTRPGSLGWGVHYPRLFTWAVMMDKQGLDDSFLVINTHWDHESKIARANSAMAMANWIHETFPDLSHVIVMGDFNCEPASDPITALKNYAKLSDTYNGEPTEGTFHAFTGEPMGGRIDMILVSSRWKTLGSGIIRTSRDGLYPSDHFPVTAQLVPVK